MTDAYGLCSIFKSICDWHLVLSGPTLFFSFVRLGALCNLLFAWLLNFNQDALRAVDHVWHPLVWRINKIWPAKTYSPARSLSLLSIPRMLAGALSFVSFIAFVSAAGPLAHVLRDSRSLPSGFTHVGPAPKNQVLNLRLGMVQSDPAGIEKALMAVSTPSSPSYGKHLSKEEVRIRVHASSSHLLIRSL